MPAPSQVIARLNTALASVSASTNLDLLISLIDSGIRAGLNVTNATTELNRRAGLVDGNTPEIEAAKIAAGYFKIDNPVSQLWAGAANSGGGIEVGQLVSGFFTNNPKYVPANGSRYLVSAYPDMAQLVNIGAIQSSMEPVAYEISPFVGQIDNNSIREQPIYVDGDVIFATTQCETVGRTGIFNISTDGGQPWTSEDEAIATVNAMVSPPTTVVEPPVEIDVLNQSVQHGEPLAPSTLRQGAHWFTTGTLVTITADVDLPDGEFMVMLEKQIDGISRDDVRRPATIAAGKLTLQVKFAVSGNYVLDPDRLSRGLQRLDTNVKLKFTPIEFEIYDPI